MNVTISAATMPSPEGEDGSLPTELEHHKNQFAGADKNNDTYLSPKELVECMDTDKDGKVSNEEFNNVVLKAREEIEEDDRVKPEDVHPLLWNIYNFASVAQPAVFVLFYILMLITVRPIVLDRGTFAFNNVLVNALIEAEWQTVPHAMKFTDIGSVDDLTTWLKVVVAPALAPKATDDKGLHANRTYTAYANMETVDGMVKLFTPPELMQHRASFADLPFHSENDANKLINEAPESTWMNTQQTCSKECESYCSSFPNFKDTGKPSVTISDIMYPGKGFVVELPFLASFKGGPNTTYGQMQNHRNKCVLEGIEYLSLNDWVDHSTRMVQLSVCAAPFTSTSATFRGSQYQDSVACIAMQFTIDRYGLLTPVYNIQAGTAFGNDLFRKSQSDLYKIICTLPAILMLFFEVNEMLVKRKEYFSGGEVWNIFDILICVLSLSFAASFQIDVVHANKSAAIAGDTTSLGMTMTGLDNIRNCRVQYGWIMFLMTLRLVKYFGFSDRIELPVRVMLQALANSFSMILFLTIWAIAMALHSNGMYGDSLESFSTIPKALVTMFRTWIGDVDFDQFQGTPHEEWGVIYMVLFGCLTMYILFTMFVSIIDEAYQAVLADMIEQSSHVKRNYTIAEKIATKSAQYKRVIEQSVETKMHKFEEEIENITESQSAEIQRKQSQLDHAPGVEMTKQNVHALKVFGNKKAEKACHKMAQEKALKHKQNHIVSQEQQSAAGTNVYLVSAPGDNVSGEEQV